LCHIHCFTHSSNFFCLQENPPESENDSESSGDDAGSSDGAYDELYDTDNGDDDDGNDIKEPLEEEEMKAMYRKRKLEEVRF